LAAWRYVHQKDNKSILGSKFKSVESKIKGYAKQHFNLELQVGEGELEENWEQAFNELYDAVTMGERCEEIELEQENPENTEAENRMEKDVEALTKELNDIKEELKNTKAELETKSSEVDELKKLTENINSMTDELETLRKFKVDTEEAAQRAERLEGIQSKLNEAEIEADVKTEADYWLGMTDDTVDKTIAKMKELKKAAEAKSEEAQAEKKIKVPQVKPENNDAKAIAAEGLRELSRGVK
jgi:hypothetical protein